MNGRARKRERKLPKKNILVKIQAILLSIMLLVNIIPVEAAVTADLGKDQTQNDDIARGLTLNYQEKGNTQFKELTKPYKIDDISKIEQFCAEYSFRLEDNLDENYKENRTVHSGDYYKIDLPKEIQISNQSGGDIVDEEGQTIAKYSFAQNEDNSWYAKVLFTDYVDNPNQYEIHGKLKFDFTLDLSGVPAGKTKTIEIPISSSDLISLDVTKPTPPPTTPISLTKNVASYNEQTGELVWKVNIQPGSGVFEGSKFTDIIDKDKLKLNSLTHGGQKLTEGQDYTYDSATGEISYTIADGRNGWNYQDIYISTTVKKSIYAAADSVAISNKAGLTGGEFDVDLESNTASYTITPNWISKSGSLYEGNKIKWNLDINNTKQTFYEGVITDTFQSGMHLDKDSLNLGGQKISVFDAGYSPADDSEIYAIYQEQQSGDILKIYLPRDKAEAVSDKQTITYVTDINRVSTEDSPEKKDSTYSNQATLDGKLIVDENQVIDLPELDTGMIPVGVPDIDLHKNSLPMNEKDKRDGTIRWEVSAASNLKNYGKVELVDTLPDDQSFVPEGIFWVTKNGNQQINENTNPQTKISDNGRELTIVFQDTNQLDSNQKFIITTKINKEIYGDNIQRKFYNQVTASLLEENTDKKIATTDPVKDDADVSNSVISKAVSSYNQNTSKTGQNPRVDFNITINSNQMPLKDVVIEDDLDKIVTQWKKAGNNSYSPLDNVKWTYVRDSLKIVKNNGNLDSFNTDEIIQKAEYDENKLHIDFGDNVEVNDKYTLSFTAELDVAKNPAFKNNGTIICNGNVASIDAKGLKNATIFSAPTGNSNEIRNEILGKTGQNLVAEQQVQWNININQHRIELENPTIVDELEQGLTLDPTTLKLYKNVIGTDNNFIDGNNAQNLAQAVNFDYTYELSNEEGMQGRYILTVKLPENNTDYILRFATDIDRKLLGKQISNTAYFSGDSKAAENFNTHFMNLSGAAGGGSVKKASITVNKRDSESKNGLSGAVFALNWLKNGDSEDSVFVRNMTTTEDGSAIFRGLTRGEKYTITEISAPEGYAIDNPLPVTITVPDSSGDAPALEFLDSKMKIGSWIPQAMKQLDGKEMKHSFEFELMQGENSVLTGVTGAVSDKNRAPVSFTMKEGISPKDILEFSNSHQFSDSDANGTEYLVAEKTFVMKEIAKDMPGYTFDQRTYPLSVNVYNEKGRDTLRVIIKDKDGKILSDANGDFLSDTIPTFVNKYSADGTVKISAMKELKGHKLEAGKFTFELREKDQVLQTQTNEEGKLAQDVWKGAVSFEPLSYTLDDIGIKNYTVVEKSENSAGYTFDTSVYKVEVLVEDQDNGKLTSSIQGIKKIKDGVETDVSEIIFNNEYKVSDISANLQAKKELTGRKLEDVQFSYILQQVDENQKLVKQITTVKNVGEDIQIPPILYKQSDIGKTYYYQLSEVNDHQKGYIYDDSVYIISEQIIDGEDGTLRKIETIKKDGKTQENITFKNEYEAKGSLQLKGIKQLDGKKLAAGQFTFGLQQFDETSGSNIEKELTVRNQDDGEVIFPELYYTQDDIGKTYSYKVYEKNEKAAGYIYDNTKYIVHVAISDNGDGTLTAIQTTTNDGKTSDILFKNIYQTEDLEVPVNGQKVLDGRLLQDNQFTFVLNELDQKGTFVRELQKISSHLDGSIAFKPLHYTQSDIGRTYYYQLREVNDDKAGYTYDDSIYIISEQILDGDDGTIKAVQTITKDGKAQIGITFKNQYQAKGSLRLKGKKQLDGRELAADQFTFAVQQFDESLGRDIGEELLTRNLDNGEVIFPELHYTQDDIGKTYSYKVYEKNEKAVGYTYDDTKYIVWVTISDNGDGTLSVKPSITSDKVVKASIDFVNIYVDQTVKAADSPSNFTSESNTDANGNQTVDTGDQNFINKYWAFVVFSMLVFGIAAYLKRKSSSENQEN